MDYDADGRYPHLSDAVKKADVGGSDIIEEIEEGDDCHIAHSLFYYGWVIGAGDERDA